MGLVHISQFHPDKHQGGVAVFARHLRRVFRDIKFLAHEQLQEPWNALEPINIRFLSEGKIDPEDTVIADGYYGLGLEGRVKRLISVCHGTYVGWVRDWLMRPHPQLEKSIPWFTKAAVKQEHAYRIADAVVSVCTSAQEELWDFYRIESERVLNGVDVDRFTPGESGVGITEVAGSDVGKGADIIGDLREKGQKNIQQLGFEGDKADRWRGFDVAVFPSRHEAGSYAQLEAMATNLKIVASHSGFFKSDVPRNLLDGTDDFYWGTFDRMIDQALHGEAWDVRSWVLEHATLKHFADGWRGIVGPN
jgi:glycosyltransferase involved in cell wall biosynthesis